MARAKFAAMMAPKGSLLHNDDSHNFTDPNSGGGPLPRGSNPSSQARGGVGARGQQSKGSGLGGRAKPTADNPANRGGYQSEGRNNVTAETRIPGHGGSPQHREREIPGDFHKRGGVGAQGQRYVPGGHSGQVHPSGGNTSGRSYKLIAGRFKRAAMGARSRGQESQGAYGSAPVTENT